MSAYDKIRSAPKSNDDHFKTTAARLEQIQTQLHNTPGVGKLKNKVCVVTGVNSLKGIGRASALLFAREGAKHLYLIDYDPSNLPELKSTIENKYPGVKVTTIEADAADEKAIKGVCDQALQEEGRLDVFFANAGWASREPLTDTSAETFMKSMRINALSCFLAVKYASAAMAKPNASRGKEHSGGSIIMTASVAGIRSGAGTVDYSASKAAVNSMAKTSAYQLQKTDIRVNSICPGLIETGMTGPTFEYARQRGSVGKIGQLNPMGRFAIAEEIATVALFLASDDSSYVNGQNLAVDGGLSSSHPVVPGRWA
jgi:NAD(P)-dependent dehydrogenase (short-subunit alcohol dehydrogenase family)